MVERQLSKLKVAGSIPASRSSPDRSLAKARGRRPPESQSLHDVELAHQSERRTRPKTS